MVKNSRFRFSFLYDTTNFPNSPFFLSTKKRLKAICFQSFHGQKRGLAVSFLYPKRLCFTDHSNFISAGSFLKNFVAKAR